MASAFSRKQIEGSAQMNPALKEVIKDLVKQLDETNSNIDWHHKRLKEYNEKAINLKETIAGLQAIERPI